MTFKAEDMVLLSPAINEVVMVFQCKSGEFFLNRYDYAVLAVAHKSKDVTAELQKAAAWCYSNASQRKTKRGMMRFLNGWLSRAPDRKRGFIEAHTDSSWAADL